MNPRQTQILDLIRHEGRVGVDDLALRFGFTVQTIRRDLTDLAEAGRVERVHGGAVLPSGTANIAYDERRALNAGAKAAIARACAAEIPDGASVFLGIGTTTEAVAAALSGHSGLLVVTNNMTVARILATHPGCEVVVTGGALRQSDGGLVGPVAVQGLRQFKVDLAVIGCSALDAAGDVLDFDLAEVEVSRAALDTARAAWLVADHAKFSRTAPARVATLTAFAAMFTDRPVPPALAARALVPVTLAGTVAGMVAGRGDPC